MKKFILKGRKFGNGYEQFLEFRKAIIKGKNIICVGPDFTVVGNKYYDDLGKKNKQLEKDLADEKEKNKIADKALELACESKERIGDIIDISNDGISFIDRETKSEKKEYYLKKARENKEKL